jgi:asparagine synthase (glutamine-hydrolysing)
VFRYLALIWNDADPEARDEARRIGAALGTSPDEWQKSVGLPGLEVHHTGAQGSSSARVLHGGTGVVLGTLFSREAEFRSAPASQSFDAAESERIVASGGRRLIERYWGRYVAFAREASADATWVLRDPSATMPCLEARLGKVDVYFSWPDDAFLVGVDVRTVNWEFLAAYLCQTRLQVHETGLANVTQVLGGECVEVRKATRRRSFHWDPLRVASTEVIDDITLATESLRRSVRDCVQAWASGYETILHTLSGGLDSSIVLACLHEAPTKPRILCLNLHSPGSNTDERSFARMAAARAGCELIERERNGHLDLKQMLDQRRSPAPESYLPYLEINPHEAALAAAVGMTGSFSGIGGDQLFYQSRAFFAAGDYLQRNGLRVPFFRIALDAARIDRLSVWTVLRHALVYGAGGRTWSAGQEPARHKTLIQTDVIDEVARQTRAGQLVHPLFRSPARVQSGKVWHAFQLLIPPPGFANPLGQPARLESVAPLYSQPLMELMLRIPTYFLTIGGWDRAVARRAFQRDVPREIITRQAKGGQEEHARAVLSRNIGFVRELLLEGALVSRGILDRGKLEEVLSGRPTRANTGVAELYEYLGAEAWLRRCGAAL